MSFGLLHKNAWINRSAPPSGVLEVTKRGYYALGMRKRSRMVPAMATVGVIFRRLIVYLRVEFLLVIGSFRSFIHIPKLHE